MDKGELKSNRVEFTKFDEHFEQSLGPSLLDLESERKTRLAIGITITITLIPVGLFLSWYLFGMAENSRRSGRLLVLAVILPFILPMCGYCLAMFTLRKKTKLHLTKGISDFLGWQHSRPKNISKDKITEGAYSGKITVTRANEKSKKPILKKKINAVLITR